MHAEVKKATPASKAADNANERRGAIPQFLSKAIACTLLEIRHLFKIEASLFFFKFKLVPTWSFRSSYFGLEGGWTGSSRCPTCQGSSTFDPHQHQDNG